jgi:hypothetical protein
MPLVDYPRRVPLQILNPPEGMVFRHPGMRDPVRHLQALEAHAVDVLGLRSCVGLIGAINEVQVPLAGSMLWSLLYRGELIEYVLESSELTEDFCITGDGL